MNAPWKPLALTPAMVRLIGSIDEFKGRWSTLRALPPGLLTQIRQDTVVEAAAATSRLEGRPIDVQSLRSQLNDGGHLDASCRSSALAVAYGRTLQVVHELHMELEPTLHHILELQRLLYAQTGLSNPGFSDEQAAQLEHILSDLRGDLEEPSQHPLISSPLFNLRLLSLRPSSAGDGRLARIVTSLLMLRAGYGPWPAPPLRRPSRPIESGSIGRCDEPRRQARSTTGCSPRCNVYPTRERRPLGGSTRPIAGNPFPRSPRP